MTRDELKDRTKKFAVRVPKVVDALPNTVAARTLSNQIARSGTSVAANYRAACRARSKADFISKLGIVEEEADETLFWLERAIDARLMPEKKLKSLMQEAEDLLKITVSSINTARGQVRYAKPASAIRNPQSAIRNSHVSDLAHRR